MPLRLRNRKVCQRFFVKSRSKYKLRLQQGGLEKVRSRIKSIFKKNGNFGEKDEVEGLSALPDDDG